MQYEIYEAKVKKVSAFLVKLYSHIALIVTILALLVAAATAAVAAKGSIVTESEFKAEIEYGSKLEFAAEAIFGDANYEYRVKGTEEWSDEAPTSPGEYEIRAYAMTSFGTRRYGDLHTFTIKPRELTLQVSEDSIQYGDMPTVSGNTVNGDTISSCSVTFGELDLEKDTKTVKARADKETLVILDKDGNDVTACYTVVDTPDAVVPLTPRPLQVTVETLTAQYNGQPFTFTGYEISGGELVEGDKEEITFEVESESGDVINQIINVGTINSTGPKVVIKDKNNVEVTDLYEVEIISGTLTVEQRPLLIQTKNGELTYSGVEQSYPEFELMDEYLLEGHTVKVAEDHADTFLDCGEYENKLSFVILDQDGNDVSSNYSINVGYGKVTVKPRKVTVTTLGTGETPFVYDGKDHVLPEFIVDNATEMDECATTGFAVRNVGTYENRFEVAFFRDTENVTYNYEIEYVYGELEVIPREITLKLDDDRKEYDGTPLTSVKYGVVADSLGLAEGHTLTLQANGSITYPNEGPDQSGTVVNEYVADSAIVTDAEGADVTANYVITVEAGSLSVIKRNLKLTPISLSRVYDGERLVGGYETVDEEKIKQILETAGHTLEVALSDNAWKINCGATQPYFIEGVTVTDAEGSDVSAYYDIDYSGEGHLEITPRPLYLKTENHSKVYDGTPLVAHAGFIVLDRGPDTGLVGDAILTSVEAEIGALPAITNVWDGDNWQSGKDGALVNVQTAKVMHNGVDLTFNYEPHYEEYGTLTVTRRKITLATDTLEKMYDGTPLYQVCEFAPTEGTTLADGQWLENVTGVIPSVTNVFDENNGVAGNNQQYAAVMAGSGDVTANYDITYAYGTLTVTKRLILLRTESIERMYDGTPLNAEQGERYWVTGSMFEDVTEAGKYFGLVDGHYAENNTWPLPSITNVNDGPRDNKLSAVIRDNMTWEDMTGNYEVEYDYGKLSLTKRPITLVSVSGEWIYDGQAHNFEDSTEYLNNYVNGQRTPFYVVEGSIADGQVLEYLDYEIPTVTDVDEGSVENRIEAVIRAGVMGVTLNYEITYESYGTLTVMPREIKVQLPNASWVYDGTAHTVGASRDGNINYNGVHLAWDSPNGDLGIGHSLYVPGLSITDAGTYTNEQVVTVRDEFGRPVKEGNYIIEYAPYGTITVERRPLAIQLYGEKIYDGQFVTDCEYKLKNYTSLCTGHTLEVALLEKDIIDAGTRFVNPDLDTLVIRDRMGRDVTKNYDPSGVTGQYVIDPRPITVQTDDGSKLYDGLPLTAPGFRVVTDFGGMELVTGHRVELNVTAAPINPGYHDNTADEDSFRVYDAKGRDVTGNYCHAEDGTHGVAHVMPGTLAISVDVTIRVTTDSAEKIYNGSSLRCDSSKWEILSGELPDNFTVIVITTGAQFDIGSSKNTATVHVIDDKQTDVTDLVFDDPENDIEYILGTLTVKDPKEELEELILTPIYRSKKYDGTPLDYSDLPWNERLVITEQLQKLLDEGYTWFVEIRGSQTKAGSCDSYVIGDSFVLYDPDGNPVTSNYILNTTEEGGKLVVYKREPIKVYLYSMDVIYDGKTPVWTVDDYVVMYDGQEIEWTEEDGYVYYEFVTAEGDLVQLRIYQIHAPSANYGEWTVSQMNERFNDCILYEVRFNGDLADLESMPVEFVMFEDEQTGYALSVSKASIEITADSQTAEYDSKTQPMLSNSGYHISKGALAEGHRISYAYIEGMQTGVGGCENVIYFVEIVDEYGQYVTNNYNISYVNGWLELT